ncbi:MAG: RNA polymerase sigma factor [Actinobacteria bacterium]|nr:RNA polymerase sigma factor [Actinomycetota bacterium]
MPAAAAAAELDDREPSSASPADLGAAIAAAAKGSEEAFRLLYRDIQPRVLRYLRTLAGEDAEDVASETWLHVARDLKTFQGDLDAFRGWVATIARNRATDHLRRISRRPKPAMVTADELIYLAAGDDTAVTALDAVATGTALSLIGTLPRDQAEAVLLRVVVGLDAKTAGQVLGKRAGAVRTATYRGLRKLAAHLQEHELGTTGGLRRADAVRVAGEQEQ